MPAAIITGAELAEWLGGNPPAGQTDLIAAAISEVLAGLVDNPAEGEPWPAAVTFSAYGAGADMFKAATGTGGGYQLDANSFTDVYRMTPTFLRRYEPLWGSARRVKGMVG